jgi:cell division septation protein DedD
MWETMMSREHSFEEPPRELRLEGLGLILLGGVLIAALVGVFFIGRWYERQFHAVPATMAESIDPLGRMSVAGSQEPADLDQDATYFDKIDGQEQELEPGREVAHSTAADLAGRSESSAVPDAGTVDTPPVQAVAKGDYYVQVFAGRDEGSAASLVSKLSSEGYPVKLQSVDEGQGVLLYKVRVGGYPTENDARGKAQELKADGYQGAWVTHVK